MAGLAIAVATGAEFIRVPVFTDTVITAAGRIEPCAAELMKWRRLLGGEDVALLCDIQTKHTFMVSSAISLEESASMAEENGADAIIVTGAHTGSSSSVDTIQRVRGATSLPLIAGSGVNAKNLPEQLSLVDAAIIGSSMKRHGKAWEPIDYELAKKLMDAAKAFRVGLSDHTKAPRQSRGALLHVDGGAREGCEKPSAEWRGAFQKERDIRPL